MFSNCSDFFVKEQLHLPSNLPVYDDMYKHRSDFRLFASEWDYSVKSWNKESPLKVIYIEDIIYYHDIQGIIETIKRVFDGFFRWNCLLKRRCRIRSQGVFMHRRWQNMYRNSRSKSRSCNKLLNWMQHAKFIILNVTITPFDLANNSMFVRMKY